MAGKQRKRCPHSLNLVKASGPRPRVKVEDKMRAEGFVMSEAFICEGSFGKVYKASFNGQPVACKVIDLTLTSQDYREHFLPNELGVIRRLNNPFIIKTHKIFRVEDEAGVLIKIYMFMELAREDLWDRIQRADGLHEAQARKYLEDTTKGIAYMHSLGIAHRDLKPENVLITNKGVAKVTDFGFSKSVYNTAGHKDFSSTFCGSPAYEAPEVIARLPYQILPADVWSLGVTLFVMVNNRHPFDDRDAKKMLRAQQQSRFGFRYELSADLEQLIESLLEPNVYQRPLIDAVLKHPWTRGHGTYAASGQK